MTIETATAAQLDAASKIIERNRPRGKELTLAERWAESDEFGQYLRLFSFSLRIPPERVATVLSVGIELGYQLRIEQEKAGH